MMFIKFEREESMKKVLICGVALAFLCTSALVAMADNGPAEITLTSTIDAAKKAKPSVFPHAKHQETLKCSDCHHSAKDGKQVPYVEGQKIEKCESCHNKAAGMSNKKLSTFKDAAHMNCKGCHKETGNKKLTKCGTCHPKKK
jgi:hypothetical protein